MEQVLEKPSFRFSAPFEVRIEQKAGMEEVHLDGLISTTDMDIVHDIATKKCLESMKRQILEKNLKLDIEHEAFRGPTQEEMEINKAKIPAGRMYDATVEELGKERFGLRVKSVLNNYYDRFEKVKGSIQGRFLDSYSIAFIPTKVAHMQVDGKDVRLLDDVTLLNVALTGNPINTAAQNREIFMKAINSVEDYKEEKKSNPEIEAELEVKSNIQINKKEEKDMTEGEIEAKKAETKSSEEEEVEAESEPESSDEVESKSMSETKSRLDKVEKDLAEIKALLKKPVLKSRVEQPDKSENFTETKSTDPLDVIA